jgi:hypothetical protein
MPRRRESSLKPAPAHQVGANALIYIECVLIAPEFNSACRLNATGRRASIEKERSLAR